jgi:glucose-specific phosphotransferase system IIA component
MFKKNSKKTLGELFSPLPGRIVNTDEVNDPVFANGMLGEGFAVLPDEGLLTLLMPASGKIASVSDTSHAVNILTDDGIELLIHVGIDTVELRGNGFELLCSVGDRLICGEPVMKVDFDELKRYGKDTVTPVIITNPEVISDMTVNVGRCDGAVALRYKIREGAQK